MTKHKLAVSTHLDKPVINWEGAGWYSIRVIFVDGKERFATRYHGNEDAPEHFFYARWFRTLADLKDYVK